MDRRVMRRSSATALLAILVLAILLRLSPLTRYLYFGSDIGEYFRISQGLAATGHVSLAYAGWGTTYPNFPGMFFLVVGPTFGGLELSGALSLVTPILGALVPAIVFLLATRVLREDRVALVAAAFVAVAMPQAFLTAHPIPAAVGELLAVAGLLLFLRLPRDPRTWFLLVPLGGALVATHHFSTYMLIVMLVFALAVRALVNRELPRGELRPQVAYLVVLVSMTLAYWLGYATTFRMNILIDVNVRPWWLALAAAPAVVLLLSGLVVLRRRSAWRYRPRYPSLRHVGLAYGVAVLSLVGLLATTVAAPVPGTTIRLQPEVLLYFGPFLVFLALSAAGRKHGDFAQRGLETTGWFLGLALSVVAGLLIAPHVLIPYRHIEYAVIALALPVGAGLVAIVDLSGLRRRTVAAAALAIVLVAGSAVSAIPPTGLVGNEDGARAEAIDVSYWTGGGVFGLLATDHRASSLAFGFGGVDATWDTARGALTAATFVAARADMEGVNAPSGQDRVEYVLVDDDLARAVFISPYEPSLPLSPEARAKFLEPPYVKVYDNGFAQVYFVNWGCADGPCP